MKTVLEIGGGNTPYFIRYSIPWQENSQYICLDIQEKNIEKSKKHFADLKRSGQNYPQDYSFVLSDATSLPIADASVDEIVLSNILSAPIHLSWNTEGTTMTIENPSGTITRPIAGDRSERDRFYRERKPVVREALRVLKPGGTLSVYTDLIIYGIDAYGRILNDLVNDVRLNVVIDTPEQERIDALNLKKLASGDLCYCFDAEVLPKSEVLRFTKK